MDYDYVKYSDKWAEEYAESEKKNSQKRVANKENNPVANEFQKQCKELYEAHKENRSNSFLSLFISESLAGLWQENK